eukprot:6758442-Prymnesium_polylepis.1
MARGVLRGDRLVACIQPKYQGTTEPHCRCNGSGKVSIEGMCAAATSGRRAGAKKSSPCVAPGVSNINLRWQMKARLEVAHNLLDGLR